MKWVLLILGIEVGWFIVALIGSLIMDKIERRRKMRRLDAD